MNDGLIVVIGAIVGAALVLLGFALATWANRT